MTAPTTLREEIRQILEASSEPLTNVEIFEKCKFAGDERSLAQALYQLTVAGDIKKAGERERVGARALALYMRVVHDGGDEGRTKAKKPRAAKPAAKKRGGPYKKRAKAARTAKKPRSAAPQSPGFRCGVFSDGSMDLERSGEIFSMTEPEVRVLFAFLEKTLPEARA
jgi:hypothetical protein